MTNKAEQNVLPTPPALAKPSTSPAIIDWLRLAIHPATVKRALVTALVVGLVLIAINQGPAILSGHVSGAHIIQMCLTVLVPYFVSTVSSVSTRRELSRRPENK